MAKLQALPGVGEANHSNFVAVFVVILANDCIDTLKGTSSVLLGC
jgi:hypothetical protein